MCFKIKVTDKYPFEPPQIELTDVPESVGLFNPKHLEFIEVMQEEYFPQMTIAQIASQIRAFMEDLLAESPPSHSFPLLTFFQKVPSTVCWVVIFAILTLFKFALFRPHDTE